MIQYDTESLGQSQKAPQFSNKWRRRIKGQPANAGSPGKMAIRTMCVCVHTHTVISPGKPGFDCPLIKGFWGKVLQARCSS